MPHRSERAEALPFELTDFDQGSKHIQALHLLMTQGKLPFDTLFRLAATGENQPDVEYDPRRTLRWNMIFDMLAHADIPEAMRPDTRALLEGERPDAIVDWEQRVNYPAYTQLDPMYYRMANLATVIRESRSAQGKTITELPERAYAYYSAREYEWSRCLGLARPIWRVLVSRIHPEWIEFPYQYHKTFIAENRVLEYSERSMRRHVIGHAVISDTVVFGTYKEAVATGVGGIGPVGRTHLRDLLADEHPELLEDVT